jgi:parvulin-like peptidyl-prolyl isomerase
MMKKTIHILMTVLLLVGLTATAQIQRGKKPTETNTKTEQTPKKTKSKKTSSDTKTKSKPKQSSNSSNNDNQSSSSSSSMNQTIQAEPGAFDVTFSCNVANANMYIDGNEYGHPKGTRTLKTGSHQVKLVAEGYEDFTTTIQVNAGSTSFDFKMTRETPKMINIDGYEVPSSFNLNLNLREQFINEAYERYKTEIDIDHFMLPLGTTETENAYAIARLDSIRNCIIQGEDWERLADYYSSDPSKSRNHGHYGFVSACMFPYEFETVLYNTPVGNVSKPFKSSFGVHIIRVNRIRARDDVHAKHILKLFPQNATDEDKSKAKAQIDAIYQKLQNGANFEELAKKESQDKTAANGGDLGWFGRGRMVQPFENIAFSLADGTYSEPFATQFGYHIVYKIAHGMATLTEIRPSIEKAIERDYRAILIREHDTNH